MDGRLRPLYRIRRKIGSQPDSEPDDGEPVKIFTTETRVRYAETDATGIVYYANYFVYFELGRIEMFRELGLPYDRHLPIVETGCRFRGSACFDDQLAIESFVQERRTKGFRIGHRVLRLRDDTEPELLVEGHTSMVTVDDENRPVPLPPAFHAAFAEIPLTLPTKPRDPSGACPR